MAGISERDLDPSARPLIAVTPRSYTFSVFQSGAVEQLKGASEVLASVAGSDLTGLTEGEVTELVLASQRAVALADAVHTVAMARLDATRGFEADGARSAATWASWKGRTSHGREVAAVRRARALRSMPVVEAAFLAGDLTADHVRVLIGAQGTAPEAFAEHDAYLVGLAKDLRFRQFEIAIRYWCYRANPDGGEADARRRYDSRRAHCSKTFEAMVAIDALLDPVGGAIYAGELERLEQLEFEADWAEARGRLGDAATAVDLRRTPAQRRADAMVEMARRSAGMPPDAKQARTLLTAVVGAKTLERICELSNGTVLTPGEVLPLLSLADIERVVFDGPSRVLDVGVRQRVFVGATRRAVEVRDRTCVHPSCDVPAERCEIDHIVPYPDGGLTVQDNGRCYCGHHHRVRHRQAGPPS